MPCSHRDICPHSSSCTKDVLKVRSMFKLLQDESPWAWLLSCWTTHCTGNTIWRRPHSCCMWVPWPACWWSLVVPLLLQSWDWCLQGFLHCCFLSKSSPPLLFAHCSKDKAFSRCHKARSSLTCPARCFTDMPLTPRTPFSWKVPCQILVLFGLGVWLGFLRGFLRCFFFFLEAVLMKWKQNQIVGCANREK